MRHLSSFPFRSSSHILPSKGYQLQRSAKLGTLQQNYGPPHRMFQSFSSYDYFPLSPGISPDIPMPKTLFLDVAPSFQFQVAQLMFFGVRFFPFGFSPQVPIRRFPPPPPPRFFRGRFCATTRATCRRWPTSVPRPAMRAWTRRTFGRRSAPSTLRAGGAWTRTPRCAGFWRRGPHWGTGE